MDQKTLYIGIDVSKSKLDTSTTYHPDSILAFQSFKNNPEGFKKLFKWVKAQKEKLKCAKMHFCLESTGIYSEEITEHLQKQGHTIVSVVNPAQTKAFSLCRFLRTKNDKVDSKMLAWFCLINKPKETQKSLEEFKILKKLIRSIDFFIEQRAHLKTKLSSTKEADLRGSIMRLIDSYSKEIAILETQMQDHVRKYELLKESVRLLESITSVGMKTACRILSELLQEEDGQLTVKAQVAHAGLAPGEKLSGSSVKGKSTICKMGNSRLRKYLFMPALGAIQNNPLIKTLYDRLISKGKHKMLALTACMRKLLAIAVGVLRNKQPFDLNWVLKKQEEFLKAA